MQIVITGALGILQGREWMFSDFEEQGPMWRGAGVRRVTRVVAFDPPFAAAPAVHAGMGMWDTDQSTNGRGDIIVEDVTAESFSLAFQIWDDTRVARVRIDWIALGPVPDPEAWQVD
ncbi:hypothetical protein DXV76_00110 [Rhodobacteraceae bacterium CCMM004]|nr:hypothetical protein DXV76_00110 [Rhodobacteraceae bacterium CCMM004]